MVPPRNATSRGPAGVGQAELLLEVGYHRVHASGPGSWPAPGARPRPARVSLTSTGT